MSLIVFAFASNFVGTGAFFLISLNLVMTT